MIHYTCDGCRRAIDPAEELRYVVKMEIYAAMEPIGGDELEDDRDHLMEVHEILERNFADGSECVSDDVYQRRSYDLCSECHKKFVKNPIGREPAPHFGFSSN